MYGPRDYFQTQSDIASRISQSNDENEEFSQFVRNETLKDGNSEEEAESDSSLDSDILDSF